MRQLALLCLVLFVAVSQASEKPAARRTMRLPLEDPKDGIWGVAFSPDGRTVAAGTFKHKVVLWDLASGKELFRGIPNREDGLYRFHSLVFSPDGKRLASVHQTSGLSTGRTLVYLWQVTGDRRLRRAQTFRTGWAGAFYSVWRAAFSPDGKLLAIGEPHGTITLWDVDTGRQQLRYHGGVAAAFAPDGRSLLSVGHDGMIHRWAAGTNQRIDPPEKTPRTEFIHADGVAFAPSGRLVAVADGYTTWLKDVATGRTVKRLDYPYAIVPQTFSPDDRLLATRADRGVCLFDTATGKQWAWFDGNSVSAFSPNGRHFAWSDGSSIFVEEMPLPQSERPKLLPLGSEPPELRLQAELIADRNTYPLDLGGLTPEEFSEETRHHYVRTPLVDLTLKLRNTGKQPLTIYQGGLDLTRPACFLAGPGAINLYYVDRQSVVDPERPEPITLAPGATHTSRITTLGDEDRSSYWLLPGEYTLYARCLGAIKPAPKGVEASEDGYGYVRLWCSPVKLRVVPAREPSADPLEKCYKAPPLGSLFVPEDEERLDVRINLMRPVNIVGAFVLGPTLQEALDFLGSRYDLDLRLDDAAFQKAGRVPIGAANLRAGSHMEFSDREGVSLNAVLHAILEPFDAGYEIRKKTVWIVPQIRPQALAERLEPAATSLRRKLAEPVVLKPGIPQGTPLADALEELSEQFDLAIHFDRMAFERARMSDVAKRPVGLAEQVDVRLSSVLRQLLKSAGARFVAREDFVLIVPLEK